MEGSYKPGKIPMNSLIRLRNFYQKIKKLPQMEGLLEMGWKCLKILEKIVYKLLTNSC